MERYLRTEGAYMLGAQLAWEACYAAVSSVVFSGKPYTLDALDALWLLARFARNSTGWYYYKVTKPFWINYLYYTSYTTAEFVRLVVFTFMKTTLHELLGGGSSGWLLPFPIQACSWTTKGVESWKAQDAIGYAAAGSPEPGDFVQPHQRYWGWSRPPMWHLVISMDVLSTVNMPAMGGEYQNYLAKLNAGLVELAPALVAGAKHVTSRSFAPGKTVDVSASTTCDYKIFGVGADLADRLHRAMEGGDLFVGLKVDVALIDELLRAVCGHVSRAGRPVSVDDCVAMHLNTGTSGPYIPVLHWDVEYGLFPEADGFNVWMLTSSDCADGAEGNVYIASTPTVSADDQLPEWIAFTGKGKCGELPALPDLPTTPSETAAMTTEETSRPAVVRRLHDLSFPERETATYSTIDELKMRFDYIGAAPGDTLHMSDPRPILESRTVKRKVIQIRVVLKPADGSATMAYNPDHPNSYLLSGWASLFDRRQEVDGKCHVPVPSTYQLLQPFYNVDKAAKYNAAAMAKAA